MFIGWFDGSAKDKSPVEAGHFLGVHVGGPTRVGHYFHRRSPRARHARDGRQGAGAHAGPDLRVVARLRPAANGGKGEVRVTLARSR